jgi:hypothetical protein
MPYEHEDWVMRPVLAGLCKYESLLNGTIHIEDILRMNDALDVKDENERRLHEFHNKD